MKKKKKKLLIQYVLSEKIRNVVRYSYKNCGLEKKSLKYESIYAIDHNCFYKLFYYY